MSSRNLDAAGITDPVLRASYEHCRRLFAAHGRTYYLATLLLPPAKRPAVHALYGFARYADEIVDDLASTLTPEEKAAALAGLSERALSGDVAGDPVLPAFRETVTRWRIDLSYVEAFLRSMAMDLTVTEYATWDDLMTYVDGSASVIGLQMLPILEPLPDRYDEAVPFARDLGTAFQLANFIRDVGEDLRRGRLYLPLEDLEQHGVSRAALTRGTTDANIRALLRFEVARCRGIYAAAEPGIRLLHPTSRPCIQAAFTLYGGILDEVERADYDVLRQRVSVGTPRRIAVAAPAWVRAVRARRPQKTHHASV
ncbi:MAG TPA: phytoene/squalene synthase family protein [Mycobacteriales bacterium]|nr:phytoene/squalene synthase family protein [Mycobacteriales bacterium]